MDELIFAGNKYISSKRAGKLAGYTTDYLGQMCRADKIDCRLVGRNWYINERVITAQKKSFKKEQGNEKKEIEYRKIELEPMYYSSDERSNYPEINKIVHEEPEEEIEDIQEEVQKVPVHIIEKPAVNIRRYPVPLRRQERQIIRRQPIVPQQIHRRSPMFASIATVLILAGTLLVAGTFTLEQVVHYSSKDKTDINTSIQRANTLKAL